MSRAVVSATLSAMHLSPILLSCERPHARLSELSFHVSLYDMGASCIHVVNSYVHVDRPIVHQALHDALSSTLHGPAS